MSGRVDRLELENFKSYKGKVTLGPFRQFTCVVGPNGSGKSNTMDAISFVLGVRASHLRGSSLKDLIYNVEGDSQGKASVSLFFNSADEGEIVFKRTVKADGSSEYRINNVLKTWDDYDAVLKKFHILTKAKNFLVFQGDVENVAQKSPKDLTALLEMVSGSDEFKSEYEDKRKKKNIATEKMLDASSKRRGAGVEKNQYKLQKKEAEKFRELRSQLGSCRREFALFQLYHIESVLQNQKKGLIASKRELKQMTERSSDGNKTFDDAKKVFADLHKKSLGLVKAFRDKTLRQRYLQSQVDKFSVQVKHKQEKLSTSATLLKKVKESGKQQNKELEQLKKQLQDVKSSQDAYEKKAQSDLQTANESSLSASQYQEWLQLKAQATTKSLNVQQEMDTIHRQKSTEEQRLKSLQSRIEQLEVRKRQLEEANQHIHERREQLRIGINKSNEEMDSTKVELDLLKEKLVQREAKQKEIEEALYLVSNELSDLRFDKQESMRDRKFAEALEQMKTLFSGVKGKITELCRIPDKRYQTAVTVAMGKNMEAIVVDCNKTAMECIGLLKEQRLPPMTFIPLDSIQAPRIDDRLRNLGGSCRPVIDCIQFDQSVEAAVRYAVGNTLVCDKLHEAKRVAYGEIDGNRHKVVTVDGSCVLKNGCIQGGQATMEKKSKKWDEHKYESKKANRDKLLEELTALGDLTVLKNKELDFNSKLVSLQASIQFSTSDIAAAERRMETNNTELDNLSKHTNDAKQQTKKIEDIVAALNGKLQTLNQKKTSIEKEVFSEFERRVHIPDIQEYEERRNQLMEEQAQKRADFTVLINKLQQQIDFHERRSAQNNTSTIERDIAEIEQSLEKDKKELKTNENQLSKVNQEVQSIVKETEQCKKEMEDTTSKIKEIKKTMGNKLDELGTVRKAISQKESACEQLRSARSALIHKCRVEEIDLPLVNEGKRKADEAASKRKKPKKDSTHETEEHEEDETTVETSLDHSESFSVGDADSKSSKSAKEEVKCLDFSALSEPLRKLSRNTKDYQKRCNEYDEQIQKNEMELDKLAPNLKAMDRFGDIEGQFEDTAKEFEKCRDEQKQAQTEFMAVAEKRHNKFMETFDIIAEEIDKVYKDLTRDSDFPAGGTAYISVDSPDEPYNGGTKYNAMPVTKRFREMEQLSGGEKTVAALALLFTLHKVRPSPFFILDEIDAALDSGNVHKVCNYILKHSPNCQFIVISLKPEFFEHADALVGVYKDQSLNASRVLTWEMPTEQDEPDPEE